MHMLLQFLFMFTYIAYSTYEKINTCNFSSQFVCFFSLKENKSTRLISSVGKSGCTYKILTIPSLVMSLKCTCIETMGIVCVVKCAFIAY